MTDSFVPRYDRPSPLPYIYRITEVGKVYVRFNTTMVIPIDEEEDVKAKRNSALPEIVPPDLSSRLGGRMLWNKTDREKDPYWEVNGSPES